MKAGGRAGRDDSSKIQTTSGAIPRNFYCPQCKRLLVGTGNGYSCSSCSRFYPTIDNIPSFIGRNAQTDSFDPAFFDFLFQMEDEHFWHQSRKDMILDLLERAIPQLDSARMLEIGCGNGNIMAFLRENGIEVEGGDLFLEGLKFCRQKTAPAPLFQMDASSLPFRDEYDLVGVFDVLEHIEDDKKVMAEVHEALKPTGFLILTVPAHKFLWSYFDELSLHKRRYTRKELTAKLEQTGFVVRKMSHMMFFLFPALLVFRTLTPVFRRSRSGPHIKDSFEAKTFPVLNSMVRGLLKLEKILMRYINLPLGSSLLVLAQRKESGEQRSH